VPHAYLGMNIPILGNKAFERWFRCFLPDGPARRRKLTAALTEKKRYGTRESAKPEGGGSHGKNLKGMVNPDIRLRLPFREKHEGNLRGRKNLSHNRLRGVAFTLVCQAKEPGGEILKWDLELKGPGKKSEKGRPTMDRFMNVDELGTGRVTKANEQGKRKAQGRKRMGHGSDRWGGTRATGLLKTAHKPRNVLTFH